MPDAGTKNVAVVTSHASSAALLGDIIGGECRIRAAFSEGPGGGAEAVAAALEPGSLDAVVIEASLSPQARSEFTGVKLAQHLRRELGYAGYLVLLGFMPREALAQRFSLVGEGVAGAEYVRLPAKADTFRMAVGRASALSEEQLREVVLAHCGLRDELRKLIHSISNSLHRGMPGGAWDATDAQAIMSALRRETSRIRELSLRFDLASAADIAARMLEMSSPDAIAHDGRDDLDSLLDKLDAEVMAATPVRGRAPGTPEAKAPVGFDTILVADDDGYAVESAAFLEERGYSVTVTSTYEEAALIISSDPCAVLLCDLTFGADATAGRRLMWRARESGGWRLVIGMSGSRIRQSEVPEADLVCAHPRAKLAEGARQIHEMICEWAATHP
jgi:CheY-like chemotaxis protein